MRAATDSQILAAVLATPRDEIELSHTPVDPCTLQILENFGPVQMRIMQVNALPITGRTADFSFEIEEVIVPPFEALPLQTEPVGPRITKDYGIDDALFDACDEQQRGLFAFLAGDELAGYISVIHDWNGCALIDDIAVAKPFRRRRMAGALLDAAVKWTRKAGLGVVRLETQANNVAACKLYQNYGFALGGYDRFLYREVAPKKQDEVALFWYLMLR